MPNFEVYFLMTYGSQTHTDTFYCTDVNTHVLLRPNAPSERYVCFLLP